MNIVVQFYTRISQPAFFPPQSPTLILHKLPFAFHPLPSSFPIYIYFFIKLSQTLASVSRNILFFVTDG